jgi:predicted DNA-binding WGR domain protein
MAERRFEFNEGSSSKFWAIERRARKVTVMFGRIGSEGQNKAKSFSTDAKAAHEEQRLVAEKLRKGYREVKGRGKVKVPPAKKVAAAHKTAVKAQG